MIDLLDVLGAPTAPMDWLIARVESIDTGPPPRLELVIGDIGDPTAVKLHRVAYLDTYVPAVDDIVHVLVKKNVGSLVIGKSAA